MGLIDDFSFKDCRSFPHLSEVRSSSRVKSTPAPLAAAVCGAAAGHLKLGQEGWLALRRYCHGKMLKWWQWYQPYYTFPCQVNVKLLILYESLVPERV